MHKLSVSAAGDRLAVEDAIEAVERRISEHTDASERKRLREHAVARLLDQWETLPFAERHAALRDAVSRVTVTDDTAIKMSFRA
jgi:RecB family exonuclease